LDDDFAHWQDRVQTTKRDLLQRANTHDALEYIINPPPHPTHEQATWIQHVKRLSEVAAYVNMIDCITVTTNFSMAIFGIQWFINGTAVLEGDPTEVLLQ
jgi:hypothetical protein